MESPNQIKFLRIKAGLSQAKVAMYLGISQPEYGRIELGRRKIGKYLEKLAEILAVNSEQLAAFDALSNDQKIAFPNRLKSLRIKAGLTQTEVANDLGISQPEYGRMELGQRKIGNHAEKLAETLAVDSEQLATLDASSNDQENYTEFLKVYGLPTPDGRIIQSNTISDYVSFPTNYPSLNLYGVLVPSEYISPRLRTGDLLLIDKSKPVKIGDLCVFSLPSETTLRITTVISHDGQSLVHRASVRGPDETLPTENIKTLHRVVGTFYQ